VIPLVLALLVACQPEAWEPPGDGETKGCRDQATLDRPIADTLGLSTHLSDGGDEASQAKRAFELSQWQEMGMGIARRDITWSGVEPVQGSFDFSRPDAFIEGVESMGVEPLGLLVYGNPWASAQGDEHGYPPDDPADYAAYAVATARHFGDRIRRYEIWNEPNSGIRFWLPQEDPAAYAELVVTAAQALRTEDPGLELSLGGLFLPGLAFNTPGLEFLEAAIEAQPTLLEQVDAVAVHPYRYPFTAPEISDDWQPSWLEDLCGTIDILETHSAGDLPLWITEMGWHTAPDALFEGVNHDEQAAYMVRSFVSGLTHGQEMYLWYTFYDGGDNEADQEQMFGLWGYDADPTTAPEPEPKRGVEAWKNLMRAAGDHDSIQDQAAWLGLGDDLWAYQLSGGEGSTWVLWSSADPGTITLPGEGEAQLLPMTGVATVVTALDGAFEIRVSGEPSYLLLP